MDYKYLKSFEGPLTHRPAAVHSNRKAPPSKTIMKQSDEDIEENTKLIDKHKKTKKNKIKGTRVLYSFERKKYGGVRMCQRCLKTKVIIISTLIMF